ncbi:LysR family transcriptional regulator [Colwelliaceae bacterium 6441]
MTDFNWDDLKVAHCVAQLGSIRRAAEQLHINYTTVLRRIGNIEQALSVKLFIRHQRGFQLTDSGQQLLDEMPLIESKLRLLQTKLSGKNKQVEGSLKITTLPEYSSFLNPLLKRSQRLYPQLLIQIDVSDDICPLESGKAHISVRAGKLAAIQGDLIAQEISPLIYSYYASPCYVQRNGLPTNKDEFAQHSWVMPSGKKQSLSFVKNILADLSSSNIVYQSNQLMDIQSAIEHGIGIGPIDEKKIKSDSTLIKALGVNSDNDNSLWFVYHKDLKNDAKVKALVQLLRHEMTIPASDRSHLS